MKCVSIVSYSVVLNGVNKDKFKPNRGLRQGDPLNPFLFLICIEDLSSLMRLTIQKGSLKGAKVSRYDPQISHLLFANDSILFGEATIQGADLLKQILLEYEHYSRQCINFKKSILFFSSNTDGDVRRSVSNYLGVRYVVELEKYLDLPNVVGRSKKE